MSIMESKMNKDVVISMTDARGLRDDILRLLTDLHENASNKKNDEVIDLEIKGGSF